MGKVSSKPVFKMTNFIIKDRKKRDIISFKIGEYLFKAEDLLRIELYDSLVPSAFDSDLRINPTTEITIKYSKGKGRKTYYKVTKTIRIDRSMYYTNLAGMRIDITGSYDLDN